MEIKRAAMIGLGAIGAVYARRLFEGAGDNFAVIADGARGERLKEHGIVLNGKEFHPKVIGTDNDSFNPDLLILCVKNYQLKQAILDIAKVIDEHTILLPTLNGVTATGELKKAFPNNPVFYGVAMRIDGVRDGNRVTNTSEGDLQFGFANNEPVSDAVQAVRQFFERCSLSHEVCPDMRRAVYKKWMLNVGVNQVSALTRCPYKFLMGDEDAHTLLRESMQEVLAIARAEGVDLREQDITDIENILLTFSPEGKTSLLQDVEGGRKTEVESFAGTVLAKGRELGIETPVNRVFYHLLKGTEAVYLA